MKLNRRESAKIEFPDWHLDFPRNRPQISSTLGRFLRNAEKALFYRFYFLLGFQIFKLVFTGKNCPISVFCRISRKSVFVLLWSGYISRLFLIGTTQLTIFQWKHEFKFRISIKYMKTPNWKLLTVTFRRHFFGIFLMGLSF
jgi:hypothetical protein